MLTCVKSKVGSLAALLYALLLGIGCTGCDRLKDPISMVPRPSTNAQATVREAETAQSQRPSEDVSRLIHSSKFDETLVRDFPILTQRVRMEETADAFAKRVLGELYDRGPIMVLNDEAHHAYRPAPLIDEFTGEERKVAQAERQVATVWISGIDRINQACGVKFCVDLSATPFYIQGSGHPEGTPFPWIVSDFGLVDAIESDITKIPRLPVSDTTGRPEPKFFRLWEAINERIDPGDRLPGRARKPKPEAVYREAEDALNTLASQWQERFEIIRNANDAADKAPLAMIIVCDNTDIAEYFHEQISGESVVEVVEPDNGTRKRKKKSTQTVYSNGQPFPELLSNTPSQRRTPRIDSKLLEKAKSDEPGASRQKAAEELRQIVSTIGKPGEPGEQMRCVISVAMLNEGWDAHNVTQILGLRAFTSQLLCEQVVGRGLRRMDYTPDPETVLLKSEYVDVYGVPFSVIPFRGRATNRPAPEDKPSNHVFAVEDRRQYEIRFPVVDGYAFALQKPAIKVNFGSLVPVSLEPEQNPTAVFVKPTVGYQVGLPSPTGPSEFVEQTREAFYESTHLQTIKFEIARQIVWVLVRDANTNPKSDPQVRLQSRHQLFPQVFRIVDEFIEKKVKWNGCDKREAGRRKYTEQIVERLITAIEPDDTQGEASIMPILNRFKPIGSSAEVNFKTVRPCVSAVRSHVNYVVQDSGWEGAAAKVMDTCAAIRAYVRNDHMGLTIPYEFYGIRHSYEPDFLVRLADDRTLILEIKGLEDEQDRAKYQAARRWVDAVNNWGQLGQWDFHVCKNPQLLRHKIEQMEVKSSKMMG